MLSLEPEIIVGVTIPVSTVWLLGSCMEALGKQELWIRKKPEVLEFLRELSIIQSVESSNRIEGVTVKAERLRPVVLGKAKPLDRSEEELSGYRKALDWSFNRKNRIVVSPEVIKKLHYLAQGGVSGDAGKWKRKNNEIVELLPNGERRVRFIPTPAEETPEMVEVLCRNYREVCEVERIPILLVIATYILDLLCIHPFRDGNGRVSRLMTTLMLLENGFEVGRFVSLERIVEENKEDYYRVLEKCSRGWHDGTNEIIPWWNFFLGMLQRAYAEFELLVESTASRPVKSDIVRQTILKQLERFTLADLAVQLPSVSPQLIKRILSELKNQGKISLEGRGRGARWEVIP
ncbi:MAG: Fic family protein [Candidatus Aegiribacteria sp.]|nr:Fic family protein [Candidatus Aegiribacteria sp.]